MSSQPIEFEVLHRDSASVDKQTMDSSKTPTDVTDGSQRDDEKSPESPPATAHVDTSGNDGSNDTNDNNNGNAKIDFSEHRKGMRSWQWKLYLVIVVFGSALNGYDVSNVATIQVPIYEAFGHINLLPWVVTAFSLGNAATSPTLNPIMHLVDLKWFKLSCWLLFLIASAVVGSSPSMAGVIVGRTILGVAGGGVYLALLTYTNLLAAPTEHARVNSMMGMGFAIGLIVGPIIGGAFANNEHATWRWAFYICLPYTGIMMLLVYLAVPNVRLRPSENLKTGLSKIDWLGAFLHMSTLILFDASCIFSGSTLRWSSAGPITLWVLTGVIAIVYTLQQRFSLLTTPENRILPITVFSTRTGLLVTLGTFFATGGYGVALYYLPLYYAFAHGDDALHTAIHLLPYICVYIVGAIAWGVLLPMIKRYAAIYLTGGLLIAAGSAAMQSVNQTTSLSQTMGITAIIGLGVGLTMQLGATSLALSLPASIRMDVGIAMTVTIYAGTTISLALAGCIFQNIGFDFLSHALRGSGLPSQEIRDTLAGVDSTALTGLDSATMFKAIGAVTSADIRIFFLPLAAGALMAITAAFMKWEALDFKKGKKPKRGKNGKKGEEVNEAAVDVA